ncbi:MAG: signal peptidase I, partial [Acidimicrobiia bacterium]
MTAFLLGARKLVGAAVWRRRGAYPFIAFSIGGALVTTALAAGVLVGWVLVGRRPMRLVVRGDSMLPTLEPGERILVLRRTKLRRGDIVAFEHPTTPGRILLKRLVALPGDSADLGDGHQSHAGQGYLLLGDNPERSTDSRHFGAVGARLLLGRAVYRYSPALRRGALDVARDGGA